MRTCVCNRTFTDLGAFTRHERGCQKGKKRLAGALAMAREFYQTKKRRLGKPGTNLVLDSQAASSSNVNSASEIRERPRYAELRQVSILMISATSSFT